MSKGWIINVGDIKPLEFVSTFALAWAWDSTCISAKSIDHFFDAYAQREFGIESAEAISPILMDHDRLLTLRRHEHIEVDTFSITNYGEADKVLSRYSKLVKRATAIFESMPTTVKAAFF